MAKTQFKANQVSDFNAGWYLGEYSDIGNAFDDYTRNSTPNYGLYVRGTPDLENAWRGDYANHPVTLATGNPPESRYSWGEKHWNKHGQGEGRAMGYALGDNYYIMSKDLANDQSAENTFAAWHFDTSGRNEPNRYGTKQAFYDSPGEKKKRDDARDERLQIADDARAEDDRLHDEKLEKERAAALLKIAEGAEYSRLASMRGGGSQTLGASGAATFKGKGLTSSENKRGKGRGTGQLRRPYGASNLSIAAGTGAGQGTGLNTVGLG